MWVGYRQREQQEELQLSQAQMNALRWQIVREKILTAGCRMTQLSVGFVAATQRRKQVGE